MFRRTSQIIGLLLGNGYVSSIFSGGFYKGILKGGCVPFLNCYACPLAVFSCPIGTLQHFMTIRSFPFLLLGVLGMVGIIFGRMSCGWLCPFGFFQDLLYKIPSDKIDIPKFLEGVKYITLSVLVIFIPFITGVTWFSLLCPAGTLTAGIPWVFFSPDGFSNGTYLFDARQLGVLFVVKLLILGVFLVLFVMTKRPFCRTVCPLGAIFSIFNRYSFVKLQVSNKCSSCGKCRLSCPVDLCIGQEPNSRECIKCLNCASCKHVTLVKQLPRFIPEFDKQLKADRNTFQ